MSKIKYTIINNKTGETSHYSSLEYNAAWVVVAVISFVAGYYSGGCL